MKKIDVVLASYNGHKYINEQIDSILKNFDRIDGYECRLLVSDDASTDGTRSIINEIQDKRVYLLDGNRKGGVKLNFGFLINHTDADYVFFSDQDDVWLPNKIELFVQEFEAADSNIPLLIHSDLQVVDQNLNTISNSMFSSQNIYAEPTLGQLLVSNSVTGCVMAINNALLNLVKDKNLAKTIMHDWFLALVAKCLGEVKFLNTATILYRQHGGNQVGSIVRNKRDYFSINKIVAFIKKSKRSIFETRQQAIHFLEEYGSQLKKKDRQFIESYVCSFSRGHVFSRAKLYLSKKISKKGTGRNLIFFFLYVF